MRALSILCAYLGLCLGLSASRPNIIFLLADDHRHDVFGFQGHADVKTPYLDQLAAEGISFSNVHHSSPICLPSRASIMTSRYESATRCGFMAPYNYSISRAEFELSYPRQLQQAGYLTGYIGKYHFPITEEKIRGAKFSDQQIWPELFDTWYGIDGQTEFLNEGLFGTKKGEHSTKVRGDLAIRFIQDAVEEGKPFCLSVGFKAPHRPWKAELCDQRFYQLYAGRTMTPPVNATVADFLLLPEVVRRAYRGSGFNRSGRISLNAEAKGFPMKPFNNEQYRQFVASGAQTFREMSEWSWYRSWEIYQEELRCYYALVSGIDDVVGRLRVALREAGVDQETVIIYSSDNGSFLGSRGLDGKDLLYHESGRAPLIIWDPRTPHTLRGTQCESLSSILDIAPTILRQAGVEVPDLMQGRSLTPQLRGHESTPHTAIMSENYFTAFASKGRNPAGRCSSQAIITQEYKYILWPHAKPQPLEQLFHIQDDPQETHDLASLPAYDHILEEMRDHYLIMQERCAVQRLAFPVSTFNLKEKKRKKGEE